FRLDLQVSNHIAPRTFGISQNYSGSSNRPALPSARTSLVEPVLGPEPPRRLFIVRLPDVVHAMNPIDVGPVAVAAVNQDSRIRLLGSDPSRDSAPARIQGTLRKKIRAGRFPDAMHRHARSTSQCRINVMRNQ